MRHLVCWWGHTSVASSVKIYIGPFIYHGCQIDELRLPCIVSSLVSSICICRYAIYLFCDHGSWIVHCYKVNIYLLFLFFLGGGGGTKYMKWLNFLSLFRQTTLAGITQIQSYSIQKSVYTPVLFKTRGHRLVWMERCPASSCLVLSSFARLSS